MLVLQEDVLLPVSITAYSDKTFTYVNGRGFSHARGACTILAISGEHADTVVVYMAGHQDAASVILREASAWENVMQSETGS